MKRTDLLRLGPLVPWWDLFEDPEQVRDSAPVKFCVGRI